MLAEMKGYNPSFRKIYEFMKKHLDADTEQDWRELIDDMGLPSTEFEHDMKHAVECEIERRYKKRHQE